MTYNQLKIIVLMVIIFIYLYIYNYCISCNNNYCNNNGTYNIIEKYELTNGNKYFFVSSYDIYKIEF